MTDHVPEKPSGLVVGWGALNVDLIFEVDDFKSLGPGPVRPEPGKELSGSEEAFQWLLERLHRVGHLRWRNGGGSAANTLFALARMGFPTAYIGKVGDDPEGDLLIQGMRPVQTHWIRKGGRSGACLIVMDRRRDRFIFVRENVANDTLALEEIDLEGIENQVGAAFFHMALKPAAQTAFLGIGRCFFIVRSQTVGGKIGFDVDERLERHWLLWDDTMCIKAKVVEQVLFTLALQVHPRQVVCAGDFVSCQRHGLGAAGEVDHRV